MFVHILYINICILYSLYMDNTQEGIHNSDY